MTDSSIPSPALYEAVFASAPIGNYLLSPTPEATILAVNDTFLKTVSRRREDLVGVSLFVAFSEDPNDPGDTGVEVLRASIAQAIATGQPQFLSAQRYPIKVRMPDGEERYEERFWNAVNTPVFDRNGKLLCISHVTIDITPQVKAEADLRAKETELREAQRLAHVGSWYWDAKTDQVSASQELLSIFGRESMPPLAEQSGTLYPPESWAKIEAAYKEALRTGIGYSVEAQGWRADGEAIWIEARAEVVYDAQGAILGLRGTAQDITKRKRDEEALLDSERRYKALFNNRTSAVAHLRVVTDDNGNPVDYYFDAVNDPWQQVMGLSREHVVGRRGTEVFPGLREQEWDPVEHLGRIALDGGEGSFEIFFQPTGQWVSIYAYSPKHGECTVVFTDITERKSAEAEIRRLNAELDERVKRRTAELEKANEALVKSNIELQRFAHAAAHDLQTPLRSIVGFTQLLQREIDGCTDERAEEWMGLVIDNTKRLQTLIQDLLNYSRLDAEARPFAPVDLQQVMEQVVATLRTPISEAGAEVTWAGLPTVMADRIQLAQVLQNLIENGIKYNRSQPPRVSVTCERRDNDWVFAVADNGIGIDPKHHDRIFEIFRRLHSHQDIPGTGIGLAICHRIVERHGGRLWVESEPGRGSVFYFSLPVEGL